jgi:hypothetical protein
MPDPPPLEEEKYEPFAHYHQEHLGLDINTRTTTVLWPGYKRITFRKYLEENWPVPVIHRKSANCAAHVVEVLHSIGDILPIGAFLAMRLQWILHDDFKTLPTKADFAKGLKSRQAKDQWSTTSLNATEGAHHRTLLCATLTKDPAHPAWCRPISLLVPRTHTSEGWSDACYEGLVGGYSIQWNSAWYVTCP